MNESLPAAQQRVRTQVLTQRRKKAQQAFQARFAAFVRGCDYQLNVCRRWPHTVDSG